MNILATVKCGACFKFLLHCLYVKYMLCVGHKTAASLDIVQPGDKHCKFALLLLTRATNA